MKVELLKEIEVKNSDEACVGCIMDDDNFEQCGEVMEILTGVDCTKNPKTIFVYKENWVTCDHKNTKVGDTVYMGGYSYVVDYITSNEIYFSGDNNCILTNPRSFTPFSSNLSTFKILLND